MDNCCISVIIPVYNTGQYLRGCLESVIGQSLKDIEIICVNDGSSDNSSVILEQYKKQDERIQVLTHGENRGLAAARKTGVLASHGQYIMFIDSDDTIDDGLCSCVYDHIQKYGIDILEFSVRKIRTEIQTERIIHPADITLTGEKVLSYFFRRDRSKPNLCSRIFRAEICKKAFHEIPDIWCYAGEDHMISFIIAYYSSSYAGIKTDSKYNYYLGRGISTTNYMSLDKFRQYCEMDQIPGVVSAFLQRVNGNETAYDALRNMTINLISNCCSYYPKIPPAEKVEALEILANHWGCFPEFVEGAINRCEKISNSKDIELKQLKDHHKREIEETAKKLNAIIQNSERKREQTETQLAEQQKLIKRLESENCRLTESVERIKSSESYRIGLAVTWIPRKIKTAAYVVMANIKTFFQR